jgi:putative transcription antitermination factor YqgF
MEEKVLAIDFGTKRIGLATSQATLATPLKIIPNDSATFEQLQEVITSLAITQIVLGLSEGKMAEQIKAFAAKLAEHTDIPIIFTDETLSSHSVHSKLTATKHSKRREPIDHYAAAEFLQNWLDEREIQRRSA